MTNAKIVILASPGISNAIIFNHLSPKFQISRVIIEQRFSRLTVFTRRYKRLGLHAALGQAAFRVAIAPVLEVTSRKRVSEIATEHGLNSAAIPPGLVAQVESANSAETINLLRELEPAVVLVNGTRILSSEVLKSVPAKFINLHAGITPRYRGVHGAYWALVENRGELCGVTVHQLDEGIDTGLVLAQATIAPQKADNFATYPMLQLAVSLPLLDSVLTALLEGRQLTPIASAEPSRLWTHPTAFEYLRSRVARGVK